MTAHSTIKTIQKCLYRHNLIVPTLTPLFTLFTLVQATPIWAQPQVVQSKPADKEKNVCTDTHLTLVFDSQPPQPHSGWIKVHDLTEGTMVDSINMAIPAGPVESREYGPECDYTKIPYDYSRDAVPTNRNTIPGTPSGTAEPTPPEYQLNIIGGFTDAFHFYPVIIHENTATINFHNNILEYGHKYSVSIDREVFGTPLQFQFTTKSKPLFNDIITVDANGNGDFATVQGALDAVPDWNTTPTYIRVLPGDYEEIVYARNKSNISITGAGIDHTRIHYPNNEVFNPHPLLVKTNEWPGTFPSRRAAFMLDNCNNIQLQNLTVATDCKGQAEGLLVNGKHIRLSAVHIIGDGDALQSNGLVYMENCILDGGGDTILGRGTLFAYKSTLRNTGGPFTWVRNTTGHHGDIFVECTFESTSAYPADFGRTPDNHGRNYPNAEMVVIDCKTKNFNPIGWSTIGVETETMLESGTVDMESGKAVDTSLRHENSRQLTESADSETIRNYRNPSFVLDGWNGTLPQFTHQNGKILNVIGDSYVANHKRPKEESWHSKLAALYGMTYNNYGRNGSCVAFDRTHDGKYNFGPALWRRYTVMDPAADYVIIIGGHNDADKCKENTDSLAMFADSLETLLTGIETLCPKAKIGYITPWYVNRKGFAQVCSIIKKICKRHNIPVMWNYSANSVIKVRDDKFRSQYFQGTNDTAHLNAQGHNLFLPYAIKWFEEQLK